MGLLRDLRKAKNITLADLAKRVGVTESQMSRIERGLCGVTFERAKLLERETGIPALTLIEKRQEAA